MGRIRSGLSVVLALAVGLGACAGEGEVAEADDAPLLQVEPAPFALVELFTSEGCNSCPPADENLARIVRDYRDEQVLALAWHVDYWNYLGWTDPYSKERFTERQVDYAQQMGLPNLSTPQMVTNARAAFLGASAATSDAQIAEGLATERATGVGLWSLDEPDGDVIEINYRVVDAPERADLHVVLVQSGLSNTPNAGENRGVTLKHRNVVRRWKILEPGDGTVELALPDDGRRSFDVLAWVQSPNTSKIHGGAKLPLDWW